MNYSLKFPFLLFTSVLISFSLTNAQWFWQNPLPNGNENDAVCFTDANAGTIVGMSGTIVHTTDGGSTWITQPSGTTNWLFAVSFTDANIGTAVGEIGTISTYYQWRNNVDDPDEWNLDLPSGSFLY